MGIPSHNKPTVLCRGTGKKTLGGNFQSFCDQLSDCFHQEEDLQNEIREMATPNQEEIISNLNDLKEDWKNILNTKGLEEINKLIKDHSSCLADMPAHCGTNRNENLHKKLKAFFKNRRNLSLEKFIALLTTCLIDHNRTISKNDTPLITLPVREFERRAKGTVQYSGFGVANVNERDTIDESFQETIPDEGDFIIAHSVNNLILVANSLTFKTTRITSQGVIVSSIFLGLQLFTNLSDLARCLSRCNTYRAERLEKPLNRAILIQYKYTIDENIPQEIQRLLSVEPNFNSIDDMQKISDCLGCVLIFVSGDRSCPIQRIVPNQVYHTSPLIFGIGKKGFFPTYSLPESNSKKTKKLSDICKCGRHASVDLACDTEGCPCFLAKIPCWQSPECRCYKCGNKYGSRLMCRDKEDSTCKCKGGCNSINCPCWRRDTSCLSFPR